MVRETLNRPTAHTILLIGNTTDPATPSARNRLPAERNAVRGLIQGVVMIQVHEMTKRYGRKTVVDNLSFTVRPGTVTGFLGPNGAGKSTTIRMILGLDTPTSGRATVNGRAYAQHQAPLAEAGALLDARAVHPGRTARSHLLALAATTGISRSRVEKVIEIAGLGAVAHQRAGSFSLGMSQRLGIAAALLGDPATLILDEPVNGLDPEGVRWVRTLLKALAAEGRTVFISSHLISEMALTAEQLIIVGRGRLIADVSVAELTRGTRNIVRVRSPQVAALRAALAGPAVVVTTAEAGVLDVQGLDGESIGQIARARGITLSELAPRTASLEEAFMELTHDDVEYRSAMLAGFSGVKRSA
jgi:ABC-2 type transport system ATP-binding protein